MANLHGSIDPVAWQNPLHPDQLSSKPIPNWTPLYTAAPVAQQYEAGDMASAAAQGFRDGVASVQQGQEPVAWLVCSVNSDGSLSLEHAAAWKEAAHEHINDAITEHGIEEAASWVVRPAYVAAPVAQQPQAEIRKADVARTCPFCNEEWVEQPQADEATAAGFEASINILSQLVDEQRQLLAEVDAVFGVDAHGVVFEDGDSALIDRVRAHLAATNEAKQPQARPDFTDEWNGYLKDGETPFERFLRERKDMQSVLKLYQRVLEENERLNGQQPQAETDNHEARGQIEFLDKKNNALLAAIRKVMARLADLLDEDQFKEIEETISSAGVQPQAEAVPSLSPTCLELSAEPGCRYKGLCVNCAAPQQAEAVPSDVVRDAERLDWLLGNGRRMAIDSFGGQYRVVDASCNLVVTDWMPSQREAIDAAIAQQKGQP